MTRIILNRDFINIEYVNIVIKEKKFFSFISFIYSFKLIIQLRP
jgi:hypothetical protein